VSRDPHTQARGRPDDGAVPGARREVEPAAPAPAWLASGAGNDFLALAEPAADPAPETVRAWCRRGQSVGADGLFVLRRTGGGAVAMTHYNADGGRAELCINGTRCAARLAFHLGWARGEVTLLTGAGPIAARDAGGDAATLELAAPGAPEQRPAEVEGAGGHLRWYVVTGGPHVVLPWDEPLSRAPVAALGPVLRAHPAFGAAGANVSFVRYVAPHRFEIRTFERGVEGETLACGSGVLAAAAVGRRLGVLELPARARTAGGHELAVDDAGGGRWSLTGDARLLARIELLPGAGRVSEPAAWS
jgi:diaminopimelate epimerase